LSSEDILNNIANEIKNSVPNGTIITNIDFEGPEVVIYTRNPSMLVSDADLIKELAKKLRKRVVIRPDSSIIMPEDDAVRKIKELVPRDAEITDISFDPGISEVIIEAKKPGLAIGKSGSTLREGERREKEDNEGRRTQDIQEGEHKVRLDTHYCPRRFQGSRAFMPATTDQ